jgi:hypothetical protein
MLYDLTGPIATWSDLCHAMIFSIIKPKAWRFVTDGYIFVDLLSVIYRSKLSIGLVFLVLDY